MRGTATIAETVSGIRRPKSKATMTVRTIDMIAGCNDISARTSMR
jgi:hypothetical protein